MNSQYSVPNASRQHFRNTLKSKLFLAFAILSAVYAALSVSGLIVSTFAAGLEGDHSVGFGIVYPILSIIATVGIFTAHSAAKSGDSERIVSGLKMSKCYIAMIVITLVAFYIASVCLLICAGGLAAIGDEIYDLIPGEVIDEITPEIEGIIGELGDFTTAFIALIFFIVGIIMLVFAILGTIYRRGISKSVKSAIKSETTESSKAKISGFAIVFGYILGAIMVLNGFDFVNVFNMFDYSPLYIAAGIIDSISSIVLGVMIFIFSLILSSLRSNLSRVIPVVQRNCPKCGSPMPAGAAFCMHCGASPYTTVPQAPEASVNTAAPTDPAEPAEAVQPESAPVTEEPEAAASTEEAPETVYCSSCGKPMPADQAFCTNCGFKLK